jgi:hypothetical protein
VLAVVQRRDGDLVTAWWSLSDHLDDPLTDFDGGA